MLRLIALKTELFINICFKYVYNYLMPCYVFVCEEAVGEPFFMCCCNLLIEYDVTKDREREREGGINFFTVTFF